MIYLGNQQVGINSPTAIKGTFTVPSIPDELYTINIGRTLNNYLFYIEMTPESITRLSQTPSSTTRKAYAIIGIYHFPEIGGDIHYGRGVAGNYRTSDGSRSLLAIGTPCTSDSIRFVMETDDYSQPGAFLYKGYTYNYTIIPID